MPARLLDRLQRILPMADKVADEIVSEETEILDKIILRTFEVMQKIANLLCEDVKRGRFSRRSSFILILQILMIAERTGDAPIYSKDKEMIEDMDGELANVIEDFLRAVDVEALRLAKRSGKYSSRYSVGRLSLVRVELVEQELLLRRLKPVETSYHQGLCCMEGTRKSRLEEIVNWVANGLEE